MYNRPYSIESVDELDRLTELADFYYALPIVSATLTDALLNGEIVEGSNGN